MSLIGEDMRRRLYDSPRSKERRAEAHTDRRSDPLVALQTRHLDERQALSEQHRKASMKLRHDQEVKRAKDRMIGNGAAPAPEWLIKERAEHADLARTHRVQAQALADRHRGQLAAAVARHPTK